MKKIIVWLLSALLFIGSFVGCNPPSVSESGDNPLGGGSSVGSINTNTSIDNAFTVRLLLPSGEVLSSAQGEEIYAIWTEKDGDGIYKSYFNAEGVAACAEADGEYQITLSNSPTGYTYDPNIYTADNERKRTDIQLYPLYDFAGNQTGSNCYEDCIVIRQVGAYRFTFEKPSVSYHFSFAGANEGRITFSSLLDVTQNEATPVLNEVITSNGMIGKRITGGGPENTYTRNFVCVYDLSNSQNMNFLISVETNVEGDKAFPVTVDLLIERSAYTGDGSELTVVAAPTNLPKMDQKTVKTLFPKAQHLYDPASKGYKFVSLGEMGTYPYPNANYVFSEDNVKYDETTGYYYLNKGKIGITSDNGIDYTHPLVVILARDVPNLWEYTTPGGEKPNEGIFYKSQHGCLFFEAGKNYTDFFNAYCERDKSGKFINLNADRAYPVNKELKEFLQDFSIENRIFYDGYGALPDKNGYKADKDSRWLFLCGYYEKA